MVTDVSSAPNELLADYAQGSYGARVRTSNIAAAVAVADTVRTTLGPQGMDKLIVDKTFDITGNAIVTNDGVTILREMDVENPAADLLIETALEQETRVGDGTTTVVLLAGALLREAARLIEDGVHPSTVIGGYHLASEQSLELLDRIAIDCEDSHEKQLALIATAMTGKSNGPETRPVAKLILDALLGVRDRDEGIDTENVKIIPRTGGAITDTTVIDGLLLEKERVHSGMPIGAEDTTIALLDGSIQFDEHSVVPKVDSDEAFQISDSDTYDSILEYQDDHVESLVSKFVEIGAEVVFVRRYIDDRAQHYLARNGIFAVRQVDQEDIHRLARVTDGRIVGKIDEFTSADLGRAERVLQEEIAGREMVRVEGVPNGGSVTMLLRSGTEHVLEELERTITDGIAAGRLGIEEGLVLPGAGAVEAELATELRTSATSVPTREQLAVESYAEALEIVPRTLARNAGHDVLDTLLRIRTAHENGDPYVGVGEGTDGLANAVESSVLEPLEVKRRAIQAATEVASMVLRVDGVIATEPLSDEEWDEVAERVEHGEEKEEATENVVSER